MNDRPDIDVAYFKGRLLERKRELTELMASSSRDSKTVTLDQTSVGRLSRMDALQGQAMALETRRRRAAEIARIDAALRRIGEGEYGYCTVTGEPIPRERLEFDPAAATVVRVSD